MWGLRRGQVCTLSCPLRNFGQPIRGDAICITSDSIIDLSHPTEELWFIELARDLLLFASKPNVNSSFPRPATVWHVFLDLFDLVLTNQRAVGCLFGSVATLQSPAYARDSFPHCFEAITICVIASDSQPSGPRRAIPSGKSESGGGTLVSFSGEDSGGMSRTC